MSTSARRTAPKDLASGALVLSSARARGGWALWVLLVVVALGAGALGSHLFWRQRFENLQQQSASQAEVQQLQQGLEQSRLQQRVSEGRSQELERQIDALNQRLRESQDELTFFRKSLDARRKTPSPTTPGGE